MLNISSYLTFKVHCILVHVLLASNSEIDARVQVYARKAWLADKGYYSSFNEYFFGLKQFETCLQFNKYFNSNLRLVSI